MLEILLLLGVMVYIVWKLESHHFERASSTWGVAVADAQPHAPPAAPPRPRLAIEGTQRPLIRDKKFVKSFGVNPVAVHDLRVYACMGRFDQFPASLRDFIGELHAGGCALGAGIVDLMFHGRALDHNEAVYFALVEAADGSRVLAFVDRLRLS